jgi:hypothetical protein
MQHFVCLDRRMGDDPARRIHAGVAAADFVEPEIDAFGNLFDMVGIFPTGGTTGPSKGANVTNLGWGTMIETAADAMGGRTDIPWRWFPRRSPMPPGRSRCPRSAWGRRR